LNPGPASQNKRMHGVLTISQVPAAFYLAIRLEGCLLRYFLNCLLLELSTYICHFAQMEFGALCE